MMIETNSLVMHKVRLLTTVVKGNITGTASAWTNESGVWFARGGLLHEEPCRAFAARMMVCSCILHERPDLDKLRDVSMQLIERHGDELAEIEPFAFEQDVRPPRQEPEPTDDDSSTVYIDALSRILQKAGDIRERLDDLADSVDGIPEIVGRLGLLEARVDELDNGLAEVMATPVIKVCPENDGATIVADSTTEEPGKPYRAAAFQSGLMEGLRAEDVDRTLSLAEHYVGVDDVGRARMFKGESLEEILERASIDTSKAAGRLRFVFRGVLCAVKWEPSFGAGVLISVDMDGVLKPKVQGQDSRGHMLVTDAVGVSSFTTAALARIIESALEDWHDEFGAEKHPAAA